MAKDPFVSDDMIERAGGKLVIGQSGFLVWFSDEVNSNLSALLEAEALVDILRHLRLAKEESSTPFDCVSVFSKLMSSLMKSSAALERDSKSLCSVSSPSSWLHQYTNTGDVATKNRIVIKLYQTKACWEEMGDEIEQAQIENFYEKADNAFNSPQRQAERRQAAAEAGEGAFGSVSPFVPGIAVRSNSFNPVMSTSFEAAIDPLLLDQKIEHAEFKQVASTRRSAPTAQGSPAASVKLRAAPTAPRVGAPPGQPSDRTSLRVQEIATWTSNASAGFGASPSVRTPFRQWLEDSGLHDPSNGLRAETMNKLHQLGCDTEVLKMMLPGSFVRAGITPDQAALVCTVLASIHDRQGPDAPEDSKCFRQSLTNLGVDEATITYVVMTVGSLGKLKLLDAGHELLSPVAVEQREKLRPLLAAPLRPEFVEKADAVGKRLSHLHDSGPQMQTIPRPPHQDYAIRERIAWEREMERLRLAAMRMREERRPSAEAHRPRGVVLSQMHVTEAYPRASRSEAPVFSRRVRGLEAPRREPVERLHYPRESEHSPSAISAWLASNGTSSVKSDRILEICDAQLFDSPEDLLGLHECGELDSYFPQRGLRDWIVQALSDDGLIEGKGKIKAAVKKVVDWNAGWGPGTGALGAHGIQDEWGNTIRTAEDGGNRAPAVHTKTLSARDRQDARAQYEQLSLQFPGLLPFFDSSRLSRVEFALTQRNNAGERVFQNSVPFTFDPEKPNTVRALMRRELHMGNGHCFVRLNVGDVDAHNRPIHLVRFVETEAEVASFCNNTRLTTEILSSGKTERVQAMLPMVYWERIIVPSGGMNAKSQMTGDPIDPTNKTRCCRVGYGFKAPMRSNAVRLELQLAQRIPRSCSP
jgi:hypothetical protein